MKTCSKCEIEKDDNCFSHRHNQCKDCIKEYQKSYREEHKEEIAKQKKSYYEENKEEIIVKQKSYYEENKEEIAKYNKLYYEENKEEIKQYQKENKEKIAKYSKSYREENKEEIAKRNKAYREENKEELAKKNKLYREENKEEIKLYREENKEEIAEQQNRWAKERRKTDPAFRLRQNISRMIYQAIKKNGGSKKGQSCVKKLGYTIEDLKDHLENQFEPWMTWENWGVYDKTTWNEDDPSTWKWQLDHILPQSDFEYTSMEDEDFKKCWDINNLRPLRADQNLDDGRKRTRHKK